MKRFDKKQTDECMGRLIRFMIHYKDKWAAAGVMLMLGGGTAAGAYYYVPREYHAAAEPIAAVADPVQTAWAEETLATAAEEPTVSDEGWKPTPGELNLAHFFPEGADQSDVTKSLAGEAFKILMTHDEEWISGIYDFSDVTPAQMAERLGRPRNSVIGLYNPKDSRHDRKDPTTWTVNSFKNIRMTATDGDGNAITPYSNVLDIMSMANLYTYFKGVEDYELFLSYSKELWERSHSYTVSMSDVYYCSGCMSEDAERREMEELEALAKAEALGIATEASTENAPESRPQSAGASSATVITAGKKTSEAASAAAESASAAAASKSAEAATRETLPESTSGVIVSKRNQRETNPAAETLETSPENAENSSDSVASTSADGNQASAEGRQAGTGAVASNSRQYGTGGSAADGSMVSGGTGTANSSLAADGTGTSSAGSQAEADAADSRQTADGAGAADGRQTADGDGTADDRQTAGGDGAADSRQTADGAGAVDGRQTADGTGAADDSRTADGAGAADDSQATPSDAPDLSGTKGKENLTDCPGHVDLIIHMKIIGLNEKNNLFDHDITGSDSTGFEEDGWQGWNQYTKASARLLSSQDWFEKYGLTVSSISARNPLTSAEIEAYMAQLPPDLSQTRKDIIRFALNSVGKVPYYWGGKPSVPNYASNSFGILTAPDYKGRIYKGLDCSGWINWVYWSVTGRRLPYESTSGLAVCGTKIQRGELLPGDIIVRTGADAHVIMFLGWTADGRIQCIHESSAAVNNVTVAVRDANWPYYRKLVD